MAWTHNEKRGTRRSEAAPGFPSGKYTIVEDPQGATLWLNKPDPERLIRGTVAECKELADALESEPTEFEYEPQLDDLVGLPTCVAEVVALARRVGASGERLKRIVEEGLPVEIRSLEVDILKKATKSMWRGIKEGEL